jgi:CHAT domain-containing protein
MSPHLLFSPDYGWLAARYAVEIAPSVSASLAAREATTRPSAGTYAFLGVGNPSFRGFASLDGMGRRGPLPLLRQALAGLAPLPETEAELQRMAALLGASRSRLLLRDAATERGFLEVEPRHYRVLAFATHAVMAGQLPGLNEPAVVLAPGDAHGQHDGLLTASDVAALELDADLVLLSACNTAAPGAGPHAEGLSGLARAFLHAGARTLLVSHWDIPSKATVTLTTSFVEAMISAPAQPRSAALRSAMLRMIASQDPDLVHPASWAAFVVVGR